jgi:hypothetical protein
MGDVEDTSKRDPLLHLAAAWPRPGQDAHEAAGDYITGMEKAGQRQLVNSDRLPTHVSGGTDDELIALGFTFGAPDPADPLFRPATLPVGWRREASDHAMWSYLLDERGIRRVVVFYNAAFYDRDAFMSVVNVGNHLAMHAIYGNGPPHVPWDKLTGDETREVRTAAGAYIAAAEQAPHRHVDLLERARAIHEEAVENGDQP